MDERLAQSGRRSFGTRAGRNTATREQPSNHVGRRGIPGKSLSRSLARTRPSACAPRLTRQFRPRPPPRPLGTPLLAQTRHGPSTAQLTTYPRKQTFVLQTASFDARFPNTNQSRHCVRSPSRPRSLAASRGLSETAPSTLSTDETLSLPSPHLCLSLHHLPRLVPIRALPFAPLRI